jgi:hypothetical protein
VAISGDRQELAGVVAVVMLLRMRHKQDGGSNTRATPALTATLAQHLHPQQHSRNTCTHMVVPISIDSTAATISLSDLAVADTSP